RRVPRGKSLCEFPPYELAGATMRAYCSAMAVGWMAEAIHAVRCLVPHDVSPGASRVENRFASFPPYETASAVSHLPPVQEQPQVELDLPVAWQHVLAELVEGAIVLALAQVRQLVDDDHLQKLRRGLAKQRGHADLLLRLELVALHPRHRGMQAEGAVGEVQAIVVKHFVYRRGAFQVVLFQSLHVAIQRLVALDFMPAGIAPLQIVAQTLLGDQLANLRQQRLGIAAQVLQVSHGRSIALAPGEAEQKQ